MAEPRLISFEGIDGCGKSTQIKKLESYLIERCQKVIIATEPGSTSYGGAFRMLLKRPEIAIQGLNYSFKDENDFSQLPLETKRNPLTELLMFIGARIEYVDKIIIPNMLKGNTVLSDRFYDSTIAYQGGGRFQFDPEKMDLIKLLNRIAVRGQVPVKTFYIDIDHTVMIERLEAQQRSKDFIEKSEEEFFKFTIEAYRRIAREEPERVVMIDGRKSIDDIFNENIKPVVDKLYSF